MHSETEGALKLLFPLAYFKEHRWQQHQKS